jgi:CspA family cold shock protein
MSTKGVVVGWNENRGFGFVRPAEGGADVFVHRRDITNAVMLSQGMNVIFDVVMEEPRGKPRAIQVRVIDESGRRARLNLVELDNDLLFKS